MTDKELRKLSRTELLKLLIEVTEENERLTAENDNLRAGGATILVDENGRPAASNNADLGDVPSARLEEIFRSAEFAAGKFLKEAQDIADKIIADAEARAGVPEEERTVRQQETASEMTPPVRQNAPMNFNSQGYAQGYSQQAMQGYGYNAYGMGNYYQTTNAYGQQGYGMQYQPGQFYLYQPGMYQNTQGAQAQTVDYGAAGYGAGDEEVNVDFVNGETPQATSTPDLPLEGKVSAQQTDEVSAQTTGAEKVAPQATDEVSSQPEAPAKPEKKKRPPTAMELLQGNVDQEEEEDDSFEVELVSIFPNEENAAPRMTLQEELASKRDPNQPMSALERLMIAKRREQEAEAQVARAKEAKEARKVEIQKNPYEHKPKGFPVPAKPKPEEETEE